MKKFFAGLISLAAAIFAVCAITVCAGAETSGDYEYSVLSDGTVEITAYVGDDTELEIPSTLDGKKVTSIGRDAFYHCTTLTSIDIPDGVTSIGNWSFGYCTSLTSITIPDSVTSIGEYAFYYCTTLTSIDIPDGVTSIEYEAFLGCSSLTSINIPDGVTSIEYEAFSRCDSLLTITIPASVISIGKEAFNCCSSLTSITVDDNSKYYSSRDGVLFNKDMTTLVAFPGGKAGEYVIPDGVTSIGGGAFSDCTNLTSIDIPDSVTSIEVSAFSGCSSLTSIDIPDSVTIIEQSAFSGCSGLTSINIPDGVTSIGWHAFKDCTSLTSIKLPNTMKEIKGHAFSGCTSLKSINIPDSVTSIGIPAMNSGRSCTFYGCTNLTTINVDKNNKYYTSKDGVLFNKDMTTVVICPQGKSGEYIVPDGVKIIEFEAFGGCSKLTSVTIPDGVTVIGSAAFGGCTSLTSIDIPDSVTSIGESAFYRTPFYDNQTTTVKYAGKCVIDCDKDATTVEIKQGTVGIGHDAFASCKNLTSIILPDTLINIDAFAFFGCSSLTSVIVPDSVTSIGTVAFEGTPFLNNQNSTVKYAGKWVIDCDSNATDITIKDGTVGIADGAFSGCSSLTSIDIPDSVTSIGGGAFFSCSSLTSIIIPNSVTSIDNSAFHSCSSLTSINVDKNNKYYSSQDGVLFNKDKTTLISCPDNKNGKYVIPDSVTSIGDSAFYFCSSLTSINIPDSVTSIGIFAFSGCSSLTSITIPDSVTSIDGSAFSRCSALKNVYYTGSKAQWDKITIGINNEYLLNANIHCLNLGVSGLKLKARAADALRISWNKNTSADGYIIEMKDGTKWTRVAKITKNSTVEYRKDKLKAGTAYSFRIRAYKMDGKTALYSGYTTISARTNPSAVTGLKLKGRAGDALRISWTKNTSADGYIIEMKSGNTWTRVGKITSNSTIEFKKSKLKAGTAYTFRVKAYKMSGKTALYGATKTISVRTNPTAVSGLKLKASAKNAVRLSWTKNTSADGYIIEMKSGNSWVRVGKIAKNSTVEFKKSKLKAGTAYTFRVKAYKMSGSTALYGTAKTISVRTNPSAVSGLKLKASAKNAVRLSWTKNTSADGYIIEMKSGNSWVRVGKIAKNSTVEFKKSGLKSKTSYTFRIKAYKMSGKTALYGATKTITVKTK